MSVEVVRLLLRVGASEAEVEDALSRALGAGQSVARALAESTEGLKARFDRELARMEAPSIEMVRPEAEQLALLPPGLADRLGVVPVRRDARTGRVDVAVLDPIDPHVASELEFHLGSKVRLLRAEPEVLQTALSSAGTPRTPSGPPLPLVRKVTSGDLSRPSLAARAAEPTRTSERPIGPDEVEPADAPPASEPVLSLSRPKPAPGAAATPSPAPASSAAPAPAAEPAPAAHEPLLPLEEVRATFDRTRTPDDVVAALLLGLAPAQAVVLAVRSNAYVGRAGSPELSQVAVRQIQIPASQPSVVQTATRAGFYLGALPHTPPHDALRLLFGNTEEEMYVVAVSASGHPSLVALCEPSALGGSLDATRRCDALASQAGAALERILMNRKRGG
ncbi:MAG TPA: hypothetical protein VNN72_10555 [Polyangiaceae bacterium]|nr:hypothetical protein [Polyangiaceae bacterium]